MLKVTEDGSVLDAKGRILFFSLPRFISDISKGNDCFICGAKPDTVAFNDEHVLPDWILRRYELHDRRIHLPNATTFRYGEFKIPCCESCNTRMGEEFEKPMSELLTAGYEALSQEIKRNGPWRLFCWMCLTFLKTHLKDKYLLLDRDRRKGDLHIGELHSWKELHHLHCVARAFYTGCDVRQEVLGSLLMLPAKVRLHLEKFDYCDLSAGQTMLLRLDETAIIAVFNDSQAALSAYYEELEKIGGALSPLQLREIAARLAALNITLVDRPSFSTEIDLLSERCEILAHRPDGVRFGEHHDDVLGRIMLGICRELVQGGIGAQETLRNVETGRYTFLVDGTGKFIANHMDLVETD